MGHSPGFEDAQWLGQQILTWMFSRGELSQTAHFDLIGSRLAIAVLRQPVGQDVGTHGLSFTVTPGTQGESLTDGCSPESMMTQMLHADRMIEVHPGAVRSRLEKPNTARRVIRELLREARELNPEEPCPVLARHQWLLVSRETSSEEIALELVVILSRWGFLEPNEEDGKAFLRWLCGLWRQPNTFVKAADEALSLLFTNWVLPQDSKDFRRYAKQTMWGLFRKGASVPNYHSISTRANSETMERAEQQAERLRRGKAHRNPARFLSIPDLASLCHEDPRRVYEKIKKGSLRAVKIGSVLRIEREMAKEFVLQIGQKQKIFELRKQLSSMGINRDAIRKQIYRLRKIGGSDDRIIEKLKAKILNQKKISKSFPSKL